MPAYLTPQQVALRWSCSTRHVERLCASGALRAMKLGAKGWRIRLADVELYEQRQTAACPDWADCTPTDHEPIRPVFGVLEEASAPLPLPERWWEDDSSAASSAAGRGRSTGKRKAALTGK